MNMITSEENNISCADASPKPRVGFFDFASCEGCQLQIANLEEEILEVIELVELVSFREVMKEHSDNYDIAFVEGSIHRPIDEERLKDIRSKADILIALGDCACTGCVNKLRNTWAVEDVKTEVYGDADIDNNPFFDVFPTKALNEIVDVDFYIRGCPVRKEQVLYYIKRLSTMPPHKNLDLRFGIVPRDMEKDLRSIIQYDPQKCILCRHCEIICNDILNVHAIGLTNKGNESIVSTPFDIGLDDNKCISCGQCLVNCPVGAFSSPTSVEMVLELLDDPENYVVFVIDPIAVASAMEVLPTENTELGPVMGSLISGLRDMGVKKVMDFTHFGYLSLAAQAEHVKTHKEMTFTSWCPSAHTYIEKFLPEFKRYIHKETSPENLMLGALRKWYGDENLKIVLISPCIVHKGNPNIDAVLSARELPRLLKSRDIDLDFYDAEKGAFDCELGLASIYVKGASSDYTYSLPIIETAYMGKFNNLDARLAVTTIGDYAHELAYDSDEGFFNALVIEDIAKASKYLQKDIKKYNVVELYPCFHGCLTGGGQVPTTSMEQIDRRRSLLKNYKGQCKAKDVFVSQIISAYDTIKGVD